MELAVYVTTHSHGAFLLTRSAKNELNQAKRLHEGEKQDAATHHGLNIRFILQNLPGLFSIDQ